MLIPILAIILSPATDTLKILNTHDHPMAVVVTIGDKSLELGVVQPGDTTAFVITVPAGVTQLQVRAFPPDNPLGQVTTTLDVKPGRSLFWDFDEKT